MPSQDFIFGAGSSSTTISSVALVLLLIAICLIFALPRKYIILPVLFSVFIIPQGNVLVFSEAHFSPVRVIILFGWMRVFVIELSSKDRFLEGRLNSIDKVFLCWAIFKALAVIVLWMQIGALINQIGFLWSTIGMYFLLRYLIRDDEDIQRVIKSFAIIATLNAIGMLYEHYKFQNIFAMVIGGVQSIPSIRDTSIRSQGAFQHAILGGTFGATLLPLFLCLWNSGEAKSIAVVGIVSSTIMTITSASSTPIMTYGAVFLALLLWPIRKKMRLLRWGIVISLIGLHLIMKAPVWYLINHVDIIGSSSGYHRAFLIDTFIRHFSDWWLVGTNDWFNWGWDMWDLSNQFVAVGQTGGLLSLVFFIFMISRSFGRIGNARKAVEGNRKQEYFMWLLGAALFGHIVAFFGVSYWDQTEIAWFALFAIISAATTTRLGKFEEPNEIKLVHSYPSDHAFLF